MGFASESRGRSEPAIPMAGMIDILFLLLVFVVSTYSLRAQETQLELDLSVSETGQAQSNHGLVVYINLTVDGRIFLGQREIESNKLLEDLRSIVESSGDNQPVVIRSDRGVIVGREHWVMDQARKVGLTNVSVATAEGE